MFGLKSKSKYAYRNERSIDLSIVSNIQGQRYRPLPMLGKVSSSVSTRNSSSSSGRNFKISDEKENLLRHHPHPYRWRNTTPDSRAQDSTSESGHAKLSCVPRLVNNSQTRSVLRSVPSIQNQWDTPNSQSSSSSQFGTPNSYTRPFNRSIPRAWAIHTSETVTRDGLTEETPPQVPDLWCSTPRILNQPSENLMNIWAQHIVPPGSFLEPPTPCASNYGSRLFQSHWVKRTSVSKNMLTDPEVTSKLGIQELLDIMCGQLPPPEGFFKSSKPKPIEIFPLQQPPSDFNIFKEPLTVDFFMPNTVDTTGVEYLGGLELLQSNYFPDSESQSQSLF